MSSKGTLNKIMLIGRLGQDPDTRYTASGTQVTTFSVATNEKYKDEETTDWHNIVCFSKLAEIVAEYCSKGMLVYVEGRIRYETYEKDGQMRYVTKIYANTVSFLSGGNGQANKDDEELPSDNDEDD